MPHGRLAFEAFQPIPRGLYFSQVFILLNSIDGRNEVHFLVDVEDPENGSESFEDVGDRGPVLRVSVENELDGVYEEEVVVQFVAELLVEHVHLLVGDLFEKLGPIAVIEQILPSVEFEEQTAQTPDIRTGTHVELALSVVKSDHISVIATALNLVELELLQPRQ